MNNNAMLSSYPDQPWWYVRFRLVAALFALAAICMSLWVDGPVRSWVTKCVVQAELPTVSLLALNSK
jgi:hypothetical protein